MRLLTLRLLALTLFVLLPLVRPVLTPAAGPPVYIVHDETGPMEALAAALEAAGYTVSVDEQGPFAERLRQSAPQAVFMYVHGDIESGVEIDLINYAAKGGRLIILHHGIASAKVRSKRWLPFAGIAILPRDHATHPWRVLRGDVEVVNLQPHHYVTTHNVEYPGKVTYRPSDEPSTEQQLDGFTLPDTEMFLNQHFTDGRRKTVLLGARVVVDGKTYAQDRAGWLMPADSGHVLYFQQGHRAEDFQNPTFVQILLNAISWKP
ncbi:MAG: ThuA domain-containing protein [Acidobacteria bacterium]|nr:ThuA domain-containing protein [Acidobacteriota bacterium]